MLNSLTSTWKQTAAILLAAQQLTPIAPLGQRGLSALQHCNASVNVTRRDPILQHIADGHKSHPGRGIPLPACSLCTAVPHKSSKGNCMANEWGHVNQAGHSKIGLPLRSSTSLHVPSSLIPFIQPSSQVSSHYHILKLSAYNIFSPNFRCPLSAQRADAGINNSMWLSGISSMIYPAGLVPLLKNPTDTCNSVYTSQRSGHR